MHTLLQVLYRRDCRRRYSPDNHWLIKELRVGQFMADLEKGKKPVVVSFQTTSVPFRPFFSVHHTNYTFIPPQDAASENASYYST